MRLVLSIIAAMLVLDLLWGWFATRSARGTRWKWGTILFLTVQILGFVLVVGGKLIEGASEPRLPTAAVSLIYLWHFVGLPLFVPLAIFSLAGACVAAIRRRRTPAASGAVDPAGAGVGRRQFLGLAAAAAPPLVAVALTGVASAQIERFRIRRFAIPLPSLPSALDGMTIVHLSDIHVGPFTEGPILDEIVRATNLLRPDMVCMTGDLINSELADLAEGIRVLREIEAPHGVWTIEGNHDLIEDPAEFEMRMRASGLNFLLDEHVTLEIRGIPVQLFGLRWVRRSPAGYERTMAGAVRQLLRGRHAPAFPILLAHHPHAFDAAAEEGVPLTLSGHTHGGQLMLSEQTGFGPALFRYWSGLYRSGNSHLVVSNGVGNWFPLRTGAPAEIVHLTLRAATDNPATDLLPGREPRLP